MPITRDAIRRAVNEEDIEGLIRMGSPSDEYEAEINKIGGDPRLQAQDLTQDQVTIVVKDVWQEMFGPFPEEELLSRKPAIDRVAQKIMDNK